MFLFEVFGLMLIMFVDLDALYIDFVKRKNSIITSFMNISHASLLILFSFSKVFKGLFHFQFSQENITQQIKKKKEKKYMIYQPLLALKMECKYLQNKVFTFLSLYHYAKKMQIKKNIV
jgi:hypothetical protein